MKIHPVQTQNFKGYDACPLKGLYMNGIVSKEHSDIFSELKTVCEKEGIDLFVHNNPGFSKEFNSEYQRRNPWTQDEKSFVMVNGKTKILTSPGGHSYDEYMADKSFLKDLGYKISFNPGFVTGGNAYIGKKPNGEKWILIGKDETKYKDYGEYGISYSPEAIFKDYGIKAENIYPISQPNYHIDMAVRPIGYPYVLVNDEEITLQNAAKNGHELESKTKKYYNDLTDLCERLSSRFNKVEFVKAGKTAQELEEYGFVPIKIGGIYSSDINYMNAIVNEHPDGTISYITNSARGSEFEGLDEVFERELRAKVPNIRDVYFISGGETEDKVYPNAIMKHLDKLHGGIHCMTLEEPDFKRWG